MEEKENFMNEEIPKINKVESLEGLIPTKKYNIKDKCKSFINRMKKSEIFNTINIIYFLFITSIACYLGSLIGCNKSFRECQALVDTNYYIILASFLIISSALFSLCLLLQIITQINKVNYLIFFFLILLYLPFHKVMILLIMALIIA